MNDNETRSAAARRDEAERPHHHSWREDRRRYPSRGLFWGLALVFLGTLFLLDRAGWISGDTWWHALLIGLGVILIVNALVCCRSRAYRWGGTSGFVAGVVLIVIGALLALGFSQLWPIILIAVGVGLLLRFFWW